MVALGWGGGRAGLHRGVEHSWGLGNIHSLDDGDDFMSVNIC